MLRRDFSLAVGTMAATTLIPSHAVAQGVSPKEGTDYLAVEPRAAVEAPAGRIEVVEFFWYNCPHCYAFEPALDAWLKRTPADVSVRRVPIAFQDSFVPQQRLYYALEAMGLVAQLHGKVFNAIHVEKRNLSKPEGIVSWLTTQGVDKDKFLQQFNSFSVNTKAARATQLQNAYRIEGVPALGVAGRFFTDGQLAKGMERALQVVDALVGAVRSGR